MPVLPPALMNLSWAQRITVVSLTAIACALLAVEGLSAESTPTAVGVVLCGALAVAALFVHALAPLVALASIAFSTAAAFLPVPLDNTFGIVELAALWWLVVWAVMMLAVGRMLLLCLGLGVAVLLLPLRMGDGLSDRIDLVVAALVVGTGFMVMLGLYLRLNEQRRTQAVELARQAQRLEYARDLHDFVAHHVTAIVAQAKAVRFTTSAGQPPSAADLDDMLAGIEAAGSEALTSMRGMITVLRGDDRTSPRHTLDEVVTVAAQRFPGPARVAATVEDGLAGRPLPPATLDAARHVVQESLTNVLRHADGVGRVEITARLRGGEVELVVRDDGTEVSTLSPGYGLVGLTERVQAIGGALVAGPTSRGWQVTATLPTS